MTIEQLLDNLLKQEGGYVNNPYDKGGPTKYGITLKVLNEYTKRLNTSLEVKELKVEVAKAIYKKNYFQTPKIDKLPELIIPITFDMAVNHGPHKAIKLVQEQLHEDHYLDTRDVDGSVGNKTIAACQAACEDLKNRFLDQLVNRRVDFYKAIIHHDPTQETFRKGWLARAESFRPETTTIA